MEIGRHHWRRKSVCEHGRMVGIARSETLIWIKDIVGRVIEARAALS
jgi:hypothetical protein